MAIYQYEQNGEQLWKVYVNVRSKLNPALRIQKKQKGFRSIKEAEREELKLLRECERELFGKENQVESWGSLVDKFEAYLQESNSSGLGPESKDDYVAAVRKHTGGWWNRVATEITRANVRELFSELKANGYSVSHLKRLRSVISKVYDFGIENSLLSTLTQAPTSGINMGKEQEKKSEILTLSEIKHLLEAAKALDDPWYPVWAMAILTGMRNGELYALTWSDIDFEHGMISVNKSYNCRRKITKSTKGGYVRSVPISTELRSLLTELKESATRTGNQHVLPRMAKWTKGVQAAELRKFLKGIGLPSVRFHALRACFSTQLIRAGVPPIQIQKICGWKDLKTMQRYIRLAGIEIEGATELLKVLPSIQVLENLGGSVKSGVEQRSAA